MYDLNTSHEIFGATRNVLALLGNTMNDSVLTTSCFHTHRQTVVDKRRIPTSCMNNVGVISH